MRNLSSFFYTTDTHNNKTQQYGGETKNSRILPVMLTEKKKKKMMKKYNTKGSKRSIKKNMSIIMTINKTAKSMAENVYAQDANAQY